MSIRQLAEVFGVLRKSVRRYLEAHKFHTYKKKLLQESNKEDYDRQLKFAGYTSERYIAIQIVRIISAFQMNIPFLDMNGTIDTIFDKQVIQTEINFESTVLNFQ